MRAGGADPANRQIRSLLLANGNRGLLVGNRIGHSGPAGDGSRTGGGIRGGHIGGGGWSTDSSRSASCGCWNHPAPPLPRGGMQILLRTTARTEIDPLGPTLGPGLSRSASCGRWTTQRPPPAAGKECRFCSENDCSDRVRPLPAHPGPVVGWFVSHRCCGHSVDHPCQSP